MLLMLAPAGRFRFPASIQGVVRSAWRRGRRAGSIASAPDSPRTPSPGVHPDLAAAATFAVAREQRSTPRIRVGLGQRERILDAQPTTPEHNNQRTQPPAVAIIARMAHHGDDLLLCRRVRRPAPRVAPTSTCASSHVRTSAPSTSCCSSTNNTRPPCGPAFAASGGHSGRRRLARATRPTRFDTVACHDVKAASEVRA